MFPAYPHFEELIVRFDVDWDGCRRPVEVRLEQWPQTRQCVLVCRFADDPGYGEWFVMAEWGRPYLVSRPEKFLFNRLEWDIITRRPLTTRQFTEKALEDLKKIIRRAFRGTDRRVLRRSEFRLARVLELSDVPDAPRIVLWHSERAWWCRDWSLQEATRFNWSPSPFHLSSEQMRDMALIKWHERGSEVRFAWEWSRWNETERLRRMTGYEGDFRELAQVMRLAMICIPKLWELGTWWTWSIQEPGSDELKSHQLLNHSTPLGTQEQEENLLEQWPPLLLQIFLPRWRDHWLSYYACVQDFWGYRPLCEVEMSEVPSMHERLEARLELRHWLQQNAPDRMELLGS